MDPPLTGDLLDRLQLPQDLPRMPDTIPVNEPADTGGATPRAGNLPAFREAFANQVLVVIASTACLTVPVSVLRERFTGWLPLYTLQATLAVVVLLTALCRHRLPTTAKAAILIASLILAGGVGVATYAFATGSTFFFLFAIMISAMLLRPWATVILSITILVYCFAVGYLFSTHRLVCTIDLNAYLVQPVAWLSSFVFMVPFTALLVLAIIRYQHSLTEAYRTLEQRVVERTAALEAAHHQLQTFTIQLDRSVEEERRRISREVHDQLGQIFTSLRMALLMNARELPPAFRQDADALVENGIVVARRIASELRPPLLDDLGLALALRHLAETRLSGSGIDIAVDVEEDACLSMQQANQLYAIAHEALTNILRHADARHVRVDGACDDAFYRLLIENDGRSFDTAQVRSGALGVIGMRERAALAGGTLTVQAGSKGGTAVIVRIPMQTEGPASS